MATIDLMILVDTQSLLQNGNGRGSTNDNPAGCNHAWAAMMTSLANATSGNGTADLAMTAGSGDTIRINSASLSNQLDYAVFVYDFQHWKGDTVLDTAGMKNRTITRLAAIPTPDQADHNPPTVTFQNGNFYIEQIDVNAPGTEFFYVKFVVYGPPNNGKRDVVGYFRWDPSISAQ